MRLLVSYRSVCNFLNKYKMKRGHPDNEGLPPNKQMLYQQRPPPMSPYSQSQYQQQPHPSQSDPIRIGFKSVFKNMINDIKENTIKNYIKEDALILCDSDLEFKKRYEMCLPWICERKKEKNTSMKGSLHIRMKGSY